MASRYQKLPPCYSNPTLGLGGVSLGGIGSNPLINPTGGGVAIGGEGGNPILPGFGGGPAFGGVGSEPFDPGGLGGLAIGGIGSEPILYPPAGGIALGGQGSQWGPIGGAGGGVAFGGGGSQWNPLVGGGGVAFGGVGSQPSGGGPGSDCSSALSVTIPSTLGPYHLPVNQFHWFTFFATIMMPFKVTLSGVTGMPTWGYRQTCPGPDLGTTTTCLDILGPGTAVDVWVSSGGFFDLDYTISFLTGSCP